MNALLKVVMVSVAIHCLYVTAVSGQTTTGCQGQLQVCVDALGLLNVNSLLGLLRNVLNPTTGINCTAAVGSLLSTRCAGLSASCGTDFISCIAPTLCQSITLPNVGSNPLSLLTNILTLITSLLSGVVAALTPLITSATIPCLGSLLG
ncbi:unnamed protein product [Medioppia subpectinata]|uniref:Uncharacterized protein n=1 Tax=Medioppia subpectinata TaxID=1979941 RepID=A0A7R9QF73_9ACAR|nr:unnamed protein product [Medioppia subpectinata]CAG2119624.1 unnamed protein product [Medioppia subpectinata]